MLLINDFALGLGYSLPVFVIVALFHLKTRSFPAVSIALTLLTSSIVAGLGEAAGFGSMTLLAVIAVNVLMIQKLTKPKPDPRQR